MTRNTLKTNALQRVNSECHDCKKWNHFSVCCRFTNVTNVEVSEDYSDNELFIDSVQTRMNNGQV